MVPFITFDQPLWLKAIYIIKEKYLAWFPNLMSCLGSFRNLTKGSGLEDLIEVVYAGDSQ